MTFELATGDYLFDPKAAEECTSFISGSDDLIFTLRVNVDPCGVGKVR